MRDTNPVERVIHSALSIVPLFIFLTSCAIAKKEATAIKIASATPTTRDMTPSLISPSLLGEWDMRHVYDMAWSPDSGMFVVNSQLQQNEPNSVQAFDTDSRKRMWIAESTLSLDLTFSTDGQSIVETNPFVGTLYLRSAKEGNLVRQITSDQCDGGQSLILDPDGNTVLVANTNGLGGLNPNYTVYISLWDLGTGLCSKLLHYNGSFHLFDVDSSGNLIAFGGEGKDDLAIIWDKKKGAEACRAKANFGRFVPGKNMLAVYSDQRISFIDALSCQDVRELNIGQPLVPYLSFSPDGEWFAIIKQSVQILETSTGRMLAQIPLPHEVTYSVYNHGFVFSPDGHYLLLRFSTNVNNEYTDKVQLWRLTP